MTCDRSIPLLKKLQKATETAASLLENLKKDREQADESRKKHQLRVKKLDAAQKDLDVAKEAELADVQKDVEEAQTGCEEGHKQVSKRHK